MRQFINIIEDMSSEPAAEVQVPSFLYHGTTPYNAALIVLKGMIEANESRDDDPYEDYSICTSEKEEVASWFYDVVRVVDQPFGFVFTIDTSRVNGAIKPFDSDSAGKEEHEWRIYGDTDLNAVSKISMVGYQGMKKRDIIRYVEEMESDYGYDHRNEPEEIVAAIMALIKKSQ